MTAEVDKQILMILPYFPPLPDTILSKNPLCDASRCTLIIYHSKHHYQVYKYRIRPAITSQKITTIVYFTKHHATPIKSIPMSLFQNILKGSFV